MGSSHEVVDLALSDEEEGHPPVSSAFTSSAKRPKACLQQSPTQHQQIEDLTHELVEIPPPTLPASRASTDPVSTTWCSFPSDGSDSRGDAVYSSGALNALEAPSSPYGTALSPTGTAVTTTSSAPAVGTAAVVGSAGAGAARCASCSSQDVPRRHIFSLEHCGHSLCATCMASKVTEAETDAPACPVIGCSAVVSVRDLALVLQEQAWDALQTRRLAAFRERSRMGCISCRGCSAWVETPSSKVAEDDVVVVVDRGGVGRGRTAGGRNAGGRSAAVAGGTARQRARGLLDVSPLLLCKGCRTRTCRFCLAGGSTTTSVAGSACACGGGKLWSAAGLLELLEELVANPADVTLTGPVKPLVTRAGAAAGHGSKGRGRSPYPNAGPYGTGRGRGRGKSGWALVAAGYGGGYHGGRGGNKGISSKWSKGTGYGGAGDEAAVAQAQAVAQEAEGRADRAMAVVFDALAACLPARGEYPEHLPEMVALVRESSLLQVVCAYLRNDSLMDIAKRKELYQVGLGNVFFSTYGIVL